MSRKGLCGRKRVVSFGVHNCSLPSAHFTRRIRRKGRSSDSVHIGLCAVRWPCSPHVIITMLLYCSHTELVGIPVPFACDIKPRSLLHARLIHHARLIRCIIKFPFPPTFFFFFTFSTESTVNEPFDHDHPTQVTCMYDTMYECSPYAPRLDCSFRPGQTRAV